MASQSIYIEIPGSDIKLYPGYKIKLNRFDSDIWTVHYGWYDFSGNRPIMGWYLTDDSDCNSVKPIQKIDLYDIYVVDTSDHGDTSGVEVVQSDFEQNNNLESDYIKNRPFFDDIHTTNIDTRYDRWEYHILEDSFHNPVLSVEFPEITVAIEPQKTYIAQLTLITEEQSGVITKEVNCAGIVNSTYYLEVQDSNIAILISGVPVNDILTGTFNIESRDNTISIMFTNISMSDISKLKSVGLSLLEETAESEIDYIEFTRTKLLDHKYFKDQYRYLNYTDNYFAITAEVEDNMVYVEVGVPVGFYSAENGTVNYTVKDGIRVANFNLASLQTIYIDMFPKNQEWDIWTLNSTEGGTVKTTPATSLLLQLTAADVESHIKYCTELYKTYLFRDDHNELGNLWAGLRWIVVFDTNENAQAFADKLNDNSGLTSITVRIKDTDYVEENIIPLIVPNTDESEDDAE